MIAFNIIFIILSILITIFIIVFSIIYYSTCDEDNEVNEVFKNYDEIKSIEPIKNNDFLIIEHIKTNHLIIFKTKKSFYDYVSILNKDYYDLIQIKKPVNELLFKYFPEYEIIKLDDKI